jgi:hypothetical protein
MSIVDRVKGRIEAARPTVSECAIVVRPLPLIADEIISAGDDFWFKVVFDPTDRHLVELEPARRLELMKGPFARGAVVILAIHKPTDKAIGKMWLLTESPIEGDGRRGLLPIQMAKDEVFLFDLWVHEDFRRNAVGITMAYEMGAAVDECFPDKRWVYGYAHVDNEASMSLMWHIYGMWTVQHVKEYQIGDYHVGIVPGSDSPKFGPFSKRGRHSGDGFQMPGRPRSGDGYRNYHHPEGFARRTAGHLEVSDDWMWEGPEWFDNDHPVGADGRPATPETLPRDLPEDFMK